MKTLELKLKKEVIIVENEFENKIDFIDNELGIFYFLCKGSELTEEMASELVETHKNCKRYIDYTIKERNRFFDLSIPSFISAVESKDKFWLENPIGNKPMSYNLPLYKIGNRCDNLKKWKEAEEKTFKNPLIFVKK